MQLCFFFGLALIVFQAAVIVVRLVKFVSLQTCQNVFCVRFHTSLAAQLHVGQQVSSIVCFIYMSFSIGRYLLMVVNRP